MRRRAEDFRRGATRAAIGLNNLVRRVIFRDTAGGQWGIEGYETPDGTEGDEDEGDEQVDVFQGLYVYARPGATDRPEGLMLHVGAEAEHPTIAALRNEDARRRYVEEFGDIAQGEIAIFNSAGKTRIQISAAGTIFLEVESGQKVIARTKGGTSAPLVTLAEHNAHVHPTGVGPSGVASPVATGTIGFEAE